ncbi:hypothetical protein VCBJG01_2208, partial [Vibrio cholerae BJG-01]
MVMVFDHKHASL